MTRTSIREYLVAQRIRYRLASRSQRSRPLDEVVAITRYHRKAVIRLLRETPRARDHPAGHVAQAPDPHPHLRRVE